MKNKLYLYKNIIFKKILLHIAIIIGIILYINSGLYSQESTNNNEGVALSINTFDSKGIVLPKVELKNLNLYEPVQGVEREGLIVENTYTDESKGITRGIYMWHLNIWDKLLNFSDIPRLAQGTKVYTGTEDPNQSTIDDIKNAPAGSLYINRITNLVLKKGATQWDPEIYIGSSIYTGSTSIALREDTTGAKVEAIVGPSLQITKDGILPMVDNSNMYINENLINIKNENAIWNASKLQGVNVDITNPADGHVLQYNSDKWINVPELVYKGKDGILITNNTIRALIDTTLNNENNQITANNSKPLWNVNKLQGIELGISNPTRGQILKYDGSKWANSDMPNYTAGTGIDEITDKTINLAIDYNTLDAEYKKKDRLEDNKKASSFVKAKNEYAIWNANKLQGKELQGELKEEYVLRYLGHTWSSFQQPIYKGIGGIILEKDTIENDTTVSMGLDTRTLNLVNGLISAKNENAVWNANKIRNIEIDDRIKPTADQLLRYDAVKNMWVPQSIYEPIPPKGGFGHTIIWDGSVWRMPELNDKVIITGSQIYFPETNNIVEVSSYNKKFLMVDSAGKLAIWNNMAWETTGNGQSDTSEPSTDLTLGFTDNSDKANLVFKTNNKEIIRVESFGQIKINSRDISFSGLDTTSSQSQEDWYITTSKSENSAGKLKKWWGTLWTMKGNEAINGDIDYILGFKNDESKSNLLLRVAGKDRAKLNSNGQTIITSENNKVIISGLKSPETEQGNRRILAIDPENRLWALDMQSSLSRELKNGRSIIGFTDLKSPEDIVIRTQNHDRLRIERSGSIKMTLTDPVDSYDLVVIDPKSGELSKSPLDKILSRVEKHLTTTDSQTQIISISDITDTNTDLKDMGIDIAGPYGNTTIHIIYTDNKPEIAKIRYGTALLKVGYDIVGNLPGILTYAYDITDNNNNILATNNSTNTIKVKDIELSFKLEKINNSYKLIPSINMGSKAIGYLILQSNNL